MARLCVVFFNILYIGVEGLEVFKCIGRCGCRNKQTVKERIYLVPVAGNWFIDNFASLVKAGPAPLIFMTPPVSYKHIKEPGTYKALLVHNIEVAGTHQVKNFGSGNHLMGSTKMQGVALVTIGTLFQEVEIVAIPLVKAIQGRLPGNEYDLRVGMVYAGCIRHYRNRECGKGMQRGHLVVGPFFNKGTFYDIG